MGTENEGFEPPKSGREQLERFVTPEMRQKAKDLLDAADQEEAAGLLPDEDQPVIDAHPCEHYWASHSVAGHLLHWVRRCMLCHAVDLDDLDAEIRKLMSGPEQALESAAKAITDRDDCIADLTAALAAVNAKWQDARTTLAAVAAHARSGSVSAEGLQEILAAVPSGLRVAARNRSASVEVTFLRQVLTDAIRACEADVLADGEAMQGLLAEYRAELAGLPEVTA